MAGIVAYAAEIKADKANVVTKLVSAVVIDGATGKISLTMGGIPQLGTDNVLAFVPQINGKPITDANSTGTISWLCNTKQTTIENSFLPANCRGT